jgi:hypothetical protein
MMVDADLGRPRDGYTPEEETFRNRIEAELAAARERSTAQRSPSGPSSRRGRFVLRMMAGEEGFEPSIS